MTSSSTKDQRAQRLKQRTSSMSTTCGLTAWKTTSPSKFWQESISTKNHGTTRLIHLTKKALRKQIHACWANVLVASDQSMMSCDHVCPGMVFACSDCEI